MKKLFLLYFAIIGVHVFSQDTWNWDGDNPIGNFSYGNNWYGDTTPSSWDSNDKLYFSYINNTSQTSISFDLGGWRSIERIIYDSTLPKSIDFNGDGNGFDIYYKIENNSNYSQTMTIPMSIKGTGLELNPINGNLTITNTIFNDYNRDYSVYGNNGKKLILSGSPRGNNVTRLYLKGQSIVEIKYNDSNSFMGGVYVEKGELWLAANAAINGGSVVLGNADANACKVYISDNSIPTNLTNAILVVYNSSNATIGSLNNSNTHEYSGFIDISNNNVKLDAVGNGNLLFSNFIFGSGSISKIGVGKVILANNNTYTGTTTISDGTLQIGDGGTTGAVEGDIINNTTLIFNRSDDYTYAGAISGTGILTKQGAGKLTLSGTNTYSGNTTVEAGTLEITGGIDCNQMTVASGATLIINGNTVKMSSLVNNGIVLVKSGHTLEVTNGITNNSGAIITVEDDGSLRQTHTGNDANTGTGTYKIYRTTRTYKEYDYN
jgi:autotransporter-associated beta strand protein